MGYLLTRICGKYEVFSSKYRMGEESEIKKMLKKAE